MRVEPPAQKDGISVVAKLYWVPASCVAWCTHISVSVVLPGPLDTGALLFIYRFSPVEQSLPRGLRIVIEMIIMTVLL